MLMLFLVHLINCFDIWVHISVMVHNIIFPNGCFTVWTGYYDSSRWCSSHMNKIWTVRLWFWISLLLISMYNRAWTSISTTVPTWKSRFNVLRKNVFTYMCSHIRKFYIFSAATTCLLGIWIGLFGMCYLCHWWWITWKLQLYTKIEHKTLVELLICFSI